MDFIIYVEEYNCGDYERITPKEQPFPEAFQKTVRYRETFAQHIQKYYTLKAVLDGDGKPIIKTVWGKRWQPKLPKGWCKVGCNHQKHKGSDEDHRHYSREMERQEWFMTFDTLESFMEFYRVCEVDLVEAGHNFDEWIPCLGVEKR